MRNPYTKFLPGLNARPTPIDAADGATNYRWLVHDWNGDDRSDLVGLKVAQTASQHMEISVLDGANDYQSFVVQNLVTPVAATDASARFRWALGSVLDAAGRPQPRLFGIKVEATGSRYVEVHVFDPKLEPMPLLLHAEVDLGEESGAGYQWVVAPDAAGTALPDLLCIDSTATPSGVVEVLTLSGPSHYQHLFAPGRARTPVALKDSGGAAWAAGRFDAGGGRDLFVIGSLPGPFVQVRVLGSVSEYGLPRLVTPTAIASAGATRFRWGIGQQGPGPISDLFCIKTNGTVSGKLEVSVLDGRLPDKTVPALSLTASPDPSRPSEQIFFAVTLPAAARADVGVYDKDKKVFYGKATPQNGRALVQNKVPLTKEGSYEVVATYPGDRDYKPASSKPVAVTVKKTRPPMVLQIDPNPSKPKAEKIKFVVRLPADATGTVGIYEKVPDKPPKGHGYGDLKTEDTEKGSITIGNTIAWEAPGVYGIYAYYNGDDTYLSTSADGTVIVTATTEPSA
ncbi:MAG TPA: Ig-like domain-containing protein [Actinomycetota bacterium]|nr:Ig-like domain-containing protein [Actinomycetota bacterium]